MYSFRFCTPVRDLVKLLGTSYYFRDCFLSLLFNDVYLSKNIQLLHPHYVRSYDFPIHYDYNQPDFVHFQCIPHHPTISVLYHRELARDKEVEQRINNQADDMQPWHHQYPRNHHRLFPIPLNSTLPHVQRHSHLTVPVTGGLLISLRKN